jgi:hypothetical protein
MLKGVLRSGLETISRVVGDNPIFSIGLMCLANATIKPLITLSNPNEPWDEKFYAAKRESLNEFVALPCCALFGWAFGVAGAAMVKPALLARNLPEKAVEANVKLLKDTLFSALGIISANFAIPNIANKIMHPLERLLKPALDGVERMMNKPGRCARSSSTQPPASLDVTSGTAAEGPPTARLASPAMFAAWPVATVPTSPAFAQPAVMFQRAATRAPLFPTVGGPLS